MFFKCYRIPEWYGAVSNSDEDDDDLKAMCLDDDLKAVCEDDDDSKSLSDDDFWNNDPHMKVFQTWKLSNKKQKKMNNWRKKHENQDEIVLVSSFAGHDYKLTYSDFCAMCKTNRTVTRNAVNVFVSMLNQHASILKVIVLNCICWSWIKTGQYKLIFEYFAKMKNITQFYEAQRVLIACNNQEIHDGIYWCIQINLQTNVIDYFDISFEESRFEDSMSSILKFLNAAEKEYNHKNTKYKLRGNQRKYFNNSSTRAHGAYVCATLYSLIQNVYPSKFPFAAHIRQKLCFDFMRGKVDVPKSSSSKQEADDDDEDDDNVGDDDAADSNIHIDNDDFDDEEDDDDSDDDDDDDDDEPYVPPNYDDDVVNANEFDVNHNEEFDVVGAVSNEVKNLKIKSSTYHLDNINNHLSSNYSTPSNATYNIVYDGETDSDFCGSVEEYKHDGLSPFWDTNEDTMHYWEHVCDKLKDVEDNNQTTRTEFIQNLPSVPSLYFQITNEVPKQLSNWMTTLEDSIDLFSENEAANDSKLKQMQMLGFCTWNREKPNPNINRMFRKFCMQLAKNMVKKHDKSTKNNQICCLLDDAVYNINLLMLMEDLRVSQLVQNAFEHPLIQRLQKNFAPEFDPTDPVRCELLRLVDARIIYIPTNAPCRPELRMVDDRPESKGKVYRLMIWLTDARGFESASLIIPICSNWPLDMWRDMPEGCEEQMQWKDVVICGAEDCGVLLDGTSVFQVDGLAENAAAFLSYTFVIDARYPWNSDFCGAKTNDYFDDFELVKTKEEYEEWLIGNQTTTIGGVIRHLNLEKYFSFDDFKS